MLPVGSGRQGHARHPPPAVLESLVLSPQLGLWLSLLLLLTLLSLYESLYDRLPDALLSLACIAYVGAVLWLAATPDQLVRGLAGGGAGFLLGLASQALRRRYFDSRAALCVGLVAGWPGILVVAVGWVLLSAVVAAYLLLTERGRDLWRVSFLPFLTLSAIVVFALRATLFR